MAERIRFVRDIGLWAFSRGSSTCLWSTSWCRRHCYAKKFYAVNPNLKKIDEADDLYWNCTPGPAIAQDIAAVICDAKRFRFSIRGEIWNTLGDVLKVREILRALPDVLFWIPTRAWQPMRMMEDIEDVVLPLPNARVMASIDPTTTLREARVRREHGWSTVYTGDNENPDQLLLTDGKPASKLTSGMHRCAKTWDHRLGHCAVCEDGCFSAGRVDVHLKQHR